MKRSTKKVIPFDELVLPYTFTPRSTLTVAVNGKRQFFVAGQEHVIDYPTYEALMNSHAKGQL